MSIRRYRNLRFFGVTELNERRCPYAGGADTVSWRGKNLQHTYLADLVQAFALIVLLLEYFEGIEGAWVDYI